MRLTVIVHKAEEGGFWAEVPDLPGCASQGENAQELLRNIYEAIEGCLAADPSMADKNEVEEVVVQAA
jgi:predicted RNase H-like HicB family nuclease